MVTKNSTKKESSTYAACSVCDTVLANGNEHLLFYKNNPAAHLLFSQTWLVIARSSAVR